MIPTLIKMLQNISNGLNCRHIKYEKVNESME